MNIIYFANLSNDNAIDIIESTGTREGILCSCRELTEKAKNAAQKVKLQKIHLATDNGNTSVIFKLVKEFADRAAELHMAIEKNEDKALKPELIKKYQNLIDEIAMRADEFVKSEYQKTILSEQTSLKPQFFMCLEDLTIPVMTQLDLEPAATGRYKKKLINLQNHGIDAAKAVLSGKMGTVEGRPYATLHALDYDSAFKVGQKAGRVKSLEGIATGLASFLNDRNYIQSYMLKGKCIWITDKKSVPQRYLRAILVTLGLIDGFSNVSSGRIPYFHGLGAGSPILIVLLSLCTFGSPQFSVDSTSPEKNASMGKIFTSKPAPMTLSVENIAQALIEGGKVWDCKCPACLDIMEKLPFDIEAARNYYVKNIAPRRIDNSDLENEEGIGRFLSFCWGTRLKPNAEIIKHARTEHSHWALVEVIKQLRNNSQSYTALRETVGRMCDAYKATTTDTYSLQIDECLKLIDSLRISG